MTYQTVAVLAALILMKPAPSARRPSPAQLDPAVRSLISDKMLQHSAAMETLLGSVLLLHCDEVDSAANRILDQFRLARPTKANLSDLNASIPSDFYDKDDAMRAATERLRASARTCDAKAIAADFGQLTQTCVACHAAYLPPDPSNTNGP